MARQASGIAEPAAFFSAKSGLKLVLMGADIRNNSAVREGGGILAEGAMIGMKGLVTILDNTSEEAAPYANLCFGADSFVSNPGLYEGSQIRISALSKMVFAKKISRFQLRYFSADSGRIDYAADGSARVETPIFASVFGSGSKLVLLTLPGVAAAAAALALRKKKKKEETKDEDKEA